LFSVAYSTSCKYPYYGFVQHFQNYTQRQIISAGALPEKASQSQDHPGLEAVCGDWKVTVTVVAFLGRIQALLSTVKFEPPAAISTQITDDSKTVFV